MKPSRPRLVRSIFTLLGFFSVVVMNDGKARGRGVTVRAAPAVRAVVVPLKVFHAALTLLVLPCK